VSALRIRLAGLPDAPAIAEVHVRSWQVTYRGAVPQDYLDRLDPARRAAAWERLVGRTDWPRTATLVAVDGEQVVGFANLSPTDDADADPATVGELNAIYELPDHWGTGAGRLLMAGALDALTQAGYGYATLWVLDSNERARRFYEIAGWRPDGTAKEDDTWGFVLSEVRYRHGLRAAANR